jgi:AcrR family transcriptional regulator
VSAPRPRGDARERLLDRVVDFVAERGVTDLSLRELAAAIGSSHRMLLHHFGSREGLLVAVIETVEARQREQLAEFVPAADEDPVAAAKRWWRHISDPSLWPLERLFFEIYGQALQDRPGARELLDGIVDSWVEPAAALYEAQGFDRERARNRARLGVAVTRGMLLDLLATGDVAATNAAMDEWIEIEALTATPRSGSGGG